ncbi:MAG: hypothetical protein K5787_21030 [Lentisphaeria bacterium]|nr:hypothetical protein [Lentisphaeria bacterium]
MPRPPTRTPLTNVSSASSTIPRSNSRSSPANACGTLKACAYQPKTLFSGIIPTKPRWGNAASCQRTCSRWSGDSRRSASCGSRSWNRSAAIRSTPRMSLPKLGRKYHGGGAPPHRRMDITSISRTMECRILFDMGQDLLLGEDNFADGAYCRISFKY